MTRTFLSLSFLTATLVCVAGCQAPCDSYCAVTADYISYCLENGSQGHWTDADWSHWGYSDHEAYVAGCQADLDTQIEGENGDAITSVCTDEANARQQHVDRGLCEDLP